MTAPGTARVTRDTGEDGDRGDLLGLRPRLVQSRNRNSKQRLQNNGSQTWLRENTSQSTDKAVAAR
jgi:hypothetical protein